MSSLLSVGHAGELGRASDRPGRPKLAIDHGLGGRDPVRPPAWAVAQLRPRPPRTSVLAAKLVWLGVRAPAPAVHRQGKVGRRSCVSGPTHRICQLPTAAWRWSACTSATVPLALAYKPASFGSPSRCGLQFNEQPSWAEFILLRLLEQDGWTGAWVKNWGGRAFWQDVLEDIELPPLAAARFREIEKSTGGNGGGCWDIFASRGDEFLFIESKQRGNDNIRPTQRVWIESALDQGIPLSSFAIVEWLAV